MPGATEAGPGGGKLKGKRHNLSQWLEAFQVRQAGPRFQQVELDLELARRSLHEAVASCEMNKARATVRAKLIATQTRLKDGYEH